MNIFDILPAFPWEGPPLPRFMKVVWPWAQPASAASPASLLSGFFNGGSSTQSHNNLPSVPTPSQATPAYENREEIEFPDGFDPDTFMPRKIVVHRRYKKRVE